MKRNCFWFLLLGLVVGFALGAIFWTRFNRPPVPKGTALLRDFSVAAVAAKAGQTNWQVIEDRVYDPFPALAHSKRIARRIIARTEVPAGAFDLFTTQFQQAASAALVAYGALNEAQFDQVQDATAGWRSGRRAPAEMFILEMMLS